MLELDYRHVDVFSTVALRGNGLVVVLGADGLATEVLQALTREIRQFESTFVTDLDLLARSARLRVFTEDEELDFAGHPVLGAAAVLHSLLADTDADQEARWALRVGERILDLRTRSADGYVEATMDQGAALLGTVIEGVLLADYAAALSLTLDDLHPSLPVQVVSTGLPYLIVPVRRGLERARISHPDFEGLLAVRGAKFVYVLDPDRPEGRTWDNAGRVEDVATGSAAGPTAGYLIQHGARPPDAPVVVHQGRFLGRPSTIEVTPDADGRLWVGGPVAPVSSGQFQARLE